MKQINVVPYLKIENLKTIIIVILAIALWFNGCDPSTDKSSITKPKKGTFKPAKPNSSNLGTIDKIALTEFIKGKPIIEYKNNEINKELALENYNLQIAYINATDSIERLKLYIDAIQLKRFEKTFENDDMSAIVKGISQGEVKEIGLDYTIKPKPIPITKFRLLAGIGINKDLINANLGFQNKKGNIFEIGYDTEKRLNISYKQTLFKIVK